MGKRKSSKQVRKAPSAKLEKIFDCPFCFHDKTVEVVFMRELRKATISCRVCTVNWENKITPLTEPIDVFCDWVDECERQNSQSQRDVHLD